MDFSEAELTAVMTAYAKATLVAQSKDLRKGRADVEQVWADLGGFGRYQLLDGLSGSLLPVLAALPEIRRVHGERPHFSAGQIRDAVAAVAPQEGGRIRRTAAVLGQAALVGMALQELPVWYDPEQLAAED